MYTGPDRHPCPACGNWKCDDCGHTSYALNRFYAKEHHCSKCRSTKGHMEVVVHSKSSRRYACDEMYEMSSDLGFTLRYPLEES